MKPTLKQLIRPYQGWIALLIFFTFDVDTLKAYL